ncbi:hypothetical protein HKX48_006626, partial [Thoreauomyces humboldtii]
SLSADNLRVHTQTHAHLPKPSFEITIRAWASAVSLDSAWGSDPNLPLSSDPGGGGGRGGGGRGSDNGESTGDVMRRMTGLAIGGEKGHHQSNGSLRNPSQAQRNTSNNLHASLPNLSRNQRQPSPVTSGSRVNSGSAALQQMIDGTAPAGPPPRPSAGYRETGGASSPQHHHRSSPTLAAGSPGGRGRETEGSGDGRLVCRLKVETQKGHYRMLPVHENDDPLRLAQEFCRDHKLPTWVHSLENHIKAAKRTYA